MIVFSEFAYTNSKISTKLRGKSKTKTGLWRHYANWKIRNSNTGNKSAEKKHIRDSFSDLFVHFSFRCSNVLKAPAYAVNVTHLIKYSRPFIPHHEFCVIWFVFTLAGKSLSPYHRYCYHFWAPDHEFNPVCKLVRRPSFFVFCSGVFSLTTTYEVLIYIMYHLHHCLFNTILKWTY